MRREVLLVLAGLCLSLCGGLRSGSIALAQAPSSVTGGETDQRRIEEIVVHARRRDELLEDVPVSVTAIGAETLQQIGATHIDDIQLLVPNLQFRRSAIAPAAPIFIRGIGQQDEALAFDQGVGVYVDGVVLSRSIGLLLDLVDVEQIEVLRGPQGTLFGRNTVGGAISVSTVKPTEDFEMYAMVRAGNFDTVDTQVTINAPVSLGTSKDFLLSRFTFVSENSDGYMKNTLRDEYFGDYNALGFLGSLRLLVTDGLTIDLSGSWERNHRRGTGAQCVPVQIPPDPQIAAIAEAFYPGYQESCGRQSPFRFQADDHAVADLESYGLWGTGNWDLGPVGVLDSLSLKSITAWRQQRSRYRVDTDFQEFPIILSSHMGGSDPLGTDGEPVFARQVSQEVQASATALDERLSTVGGAFFFWEDADDTTGLTAFRYNAAGDDLLGVGTSVSEVDIDNWSWALFGQTTVDVTDWLSVTGGVRYTEDHKGLSKLEKYPLLADPDPRVDADEHKTFAEWTPMASLALTVPDGLLDSLRIDHLMGYFSYARGFKGGGFNAITGSQVPEGETATRLDNFKPEKVDSFEIGFKSLAFDWLAFNTALFLAKYDDIQVVVGKLVPGDGDTLPTMLRVVRNAARATIRGLEIEALARPWNGLTLAGSLGLLDAEFDKFDNAQSDLTGEDIDRGGESFPNVPDLQAHVSIQYELPIGAGVDWVAGTLTPRLDWYYQSEVHYAGPELEALVQDGYNLVDVRLGYELLHDRITLALWSKNLLDETYFSGGGPFATLQGNVIRFTSLPRTYGGEIHLRF
jgi:iron complex outermembrane receptor protein